MRKSIKIVLMTIVVFALLIGVSRPTYASTSINEKLGVPILVLGDNLSDAQKEDVREALDVKDDDTVEEYTITGKDVAKYINGNPDARMFSSAKIVREEEGKGLTINIETPDNITEVTSEMYANALLTAGVENATVDVASPMKVSGHSALTGIYKAYDVQGVELDKERMELANEELGVATDLADKDGLSQEKVSELLTEIKKEIADKNPATKEEVEKIVQDQLSKLDISLSDADRQMLIDLFNKMRDLNIDFDKVKNQLEDLTGTIKDKVDELGLDEGFWNKVANFFSELFDSLGNFLKGLFN